MHSVTRIGKTMKTDQTTLMHETLDTVFFVFFYAFTVYGSWGNLRKGEGEKQNDQWEKNI